MAERGRAAVAMGGRRGGRAAAAAVRPSTMSPARAHAPLALIAALCALIALLPGVQPVKISNFEVPSTAVAGDNAGLQCHYELTDGETEKQVIVKWWWTPLNGSLEQSRQLYQRIADKPAQLVRSDLVVKGKDSLELSDVQPEDSGAYECEVATTLDEARQNQRLVVYTEGSGPELNATLIEDGDDDDDESDVLITCQARDVAPEPELAISIDTQIQKVEQWVSAPVSGRYNVSASVTVSQAVAAGAELRCDMFYRDDTIVHPEFKDTIEFVAEGAETTTEEPLGTTEAYEETTTEQDSAAGPPSAMTTMLALFCGVTVTLF